MAPRQPRPTDGDTYAAPVRSSRPTSATSSGEGRTSTRRTKAAAKKASRATSTKSSRTSSKAKGSGRKTSSSKTSSTSRARGASRASTKATAGPGLLARWRMVRPVALATGALGCAYAAVALLGYHPTDPAFSRTGTFEVANPAGPIGAFLADLLLQVFGWGSMMVVPLGAALVWRLAGRSLGGYVRVLSAGTASWGVLCLAALLVPGSADSAYPAGGIIGILTVDGLQQLIGPAGTWMTVLAVLGGSLVAVWRYSLEDLADRGVEGLEAHGPRLGRWSLEAGRTFLAGLWGAGRSMLEHRPRWQDEEYEEEALEEIDSLPGLSDPNEPEVGVVPTPTADEREHFSIFTPAPMSSHADAPEDRTQVAQAALAEVEWVPTVATGLDPAPSTPTPRVEIPIHAGTPARDTQVRGQAEHSGHPVEPPPEPPAATQAPPQAPDIFRHTRSQASGRASEAPGRADPPSDWPAGERALSDEQELDHVLGGPAPSVASVAGLEAPTAPDDEPTVPSVFDIPSEASVVAAPEPLPARPPAVDPGRNPQQVQAPAGSSPARPPDVVPMRSTLERQRADAAKAEGIEVTPGDLVSGGNEDEGPAVVDYSQHTPFELPHLGLLDFHLRDVAQVDTAGLRELGLILEQKLADFGVNGEVKAIRPGPVITTFEYLPAPGVKISKISGLSDDIAMALKALRVRIVAPIPGKGVVGIEIPNKARQVVWIRDLMSSDSFRKADYELPLVLGKNVEGKPRIADLAKMPHLLVGGTTGSGKSVGINAMLTSLLYTRTPDELRLLMIDPKMLEFELYQDIPHLLFPVVTEAKLASAVLKWACVEMDDRYRLLARWQTRNIINYNERVEKELKDWTPEKARKFAPRDWPSSEPPPRPEKMPYIVIVIDELADLMMAAAKDVEESIIRIAQKARAAGIHLIVATQRPSVNVITGLIKANMPSRIAYQVRTKVDSRTILDQNGAESLLGKGDMLFLPPGVAALERCHGAFVSDDEARRMADFLREQGEPSYDLDIRAEDDAASVGDLSDEDYDEFYDEAVAFITDAGKASTSMIQRRFKIGYNRAARIIDIMEREGVVGAADGARPRKVLVQNHGD